MKNKKVVVIGGGHGQSTICKGIKNIEGIDISAIVTVADDGGSTGRLRKQFHIPAMGDIRNVMIALSANDDLMTELMEYRFDDPNGTEEDVAGHNLGNLILTALTQTCGSFFEAVQKIQNILNVKGKIIPATSQVITLYAQMEDGVVVRGEANIPDVNNHIKKVFYETFVVAEKEAIHAIKEADLIIYGIGSVYTSILPNVIIPDIRSALQQSHAKKVYFCNAMSQPGETDGYSVEDYVEALKKHGAPVDAVVVASDPIPQQSIQAYRAEGSTVVSIMKPQHEYQIIEEPLLYFDGHLIRHDPEKIKEVVEKLVSAL